MSDEKEELDIDLGIDQTTIEESIKKGLEDGVKKGTAKGTTTGVQPIAARAAEEAVKNLMNPGGNAQVEKAIKNVGDMYQVEALKTMVENMKAKQQPNVIPQQQQEIEPGEKFKKMMNTMAGMGIDIKEMLSDPKLIFLAYSNPDMLPFLIMQNTDKKQTSNASELLPLLLMQKQQQAAPAPAPPQNDNTQLLAIILQMQQQQQQAQAQMFQQMMQMQAQAADEKAQLIVKAMEPYMQHRSFAEEVSELQEKVDGLKAIGVLNQGARTEKDAELDFEAKKMGMELSKEKMQMERQEKQDAIKLQQQQTQMEMLMKGLGTFKNVLKNMPLMEQAPAPQAPPQQAQSFGMVPPAPQIPSPPQQSGKISMAINNMLRKAQQSLQGDESDGE